MTEQCKHKELAGYCPFCQVEELQRELAAARTELAQARRELERSPLKLDDFKGRYTKDVSAAIVGKGPSLDALSLCDIEDFQVLVCLNESIQAIEKLTKKIKYSPAVYVVQQDCDTDMGTRCVPQNNGQYADIKNVVHFMNENQTVRNAEGKAVTAKVTVSPYNEKAVLYDPFRLGAQSTTCELSAIIALHLAKFMGLANVTFLCFDAWQPGGSCEYAQSLNVGRSSGAVGEPGRHCSHKGYILTRARELGMVTRIGYPSKNGE